VRTIGAWVNDASSIPALLRQTDMLGTFPPILVSEGLDRLGLCALQPPVPIPALPMQFIWSLRLTNDPGSKWFRDIVINVFNEQRLAGERTIRKHGVTKPMPSKRKPQRRSAS
jgi:DNA-binding transcriptional LysR family regulator